MILFIALNKVKDVYILICSVKEKTHV